MQDLTDWSRCLSLSYYPLGASRKSLGLEQGERPQCSHFVQDRQVPSLLLVKNPTAPRTTSACPRSTLGKTQAGKGLFRDVPLPPLSPGGQCPSADRALTQYVIFKNDFSLPVFFSPVFSVELRISVYLV